MRLLYYLPCPLRIEPQLREAAPLEGCPETPPPRVGAVIWWQSKPCSFEPESFIILTKQTENNTYKGVHVMTGKHAKVCAVTDSRLLGKLSSEAEFSCSRCGAKAHDKASVCDPIPLEPDH